MVAEAYHFSMHKLLAVLGLLALPLSAETYQARSPHHSIVLEGKGGQYEVRVTDLDTNTVLMTSMMRGDHTATQRTGRFLVSLHAWEAQGVLTVSVKIDTDGKLVDSFEGNWLTRPQPAPEPVIDAPLRVGGDVKAPVVIRRVEPLYPDKALNDRIQGIVILEVLIDRTGRVRDARVLKPLPEGLSEAAVDAVRQWTFLPGTFIGKPVDVYYNLTIAFHLK